MSAIRIETTINSDTLYLPQLKPLVGKNVEIIVREVAQHVPGSGNGVWVSPLAGSVIDYVDPFEPASSPEDWEANR